MRNQGITKKAYECLFNQDFLYYGPHIHPKATNANTLICYCYFLGLFDVFGHVFGPKQVTVAQTV